jgi:hypothetical protein
MYIYVIALVLLLVIAIAGYSFLNHSIEKRRIRHQRLVTAIRARRSVFRDLATGFPGGFLSKDLMALLYRSLIECCDQLSRLEPKDTAHHDQLAHYTTQLNELKDQAQPARVRLENPQQIREARQLLQELMKYVIQQAQQHLINSVQAEAYIDQIKRLVMQIAVDGHIINAKQSQAVGKIRLAIHHYGLAKKSLVSENVTRTYDKQIAQLDALIQKLEEKAATTQENQTTVNTEKKLEDKEWDKVKPVEKKDAWKVKNLYD